MIHADVIIVGGGPAGSACAWRLKQRGFHCMVLDQAAFPRFKPCAGWITPLVLKDLQFTPEDYPHGFTRLNRLRLNIRDLRLRLPASMYAIRRVEFDHWLLERSGAPVYQHTVRSIQPDGEGFVIDGSYSAQFLVGAGGTYCPVYRTLFKAEFPKARADLIAAQEEEFQYEHASEDCWLWLRKDLPGYAWYVPKADGYINVGVGAWAEALTAGGDTLKVHWDRLVEKLDQFGLVRGHAYDPSAHTYFLRQPAPLLRKGNALLAGDAAGLATLDMGEGIGAAVRSGLLAAEAIASGKSYAVDSIPRYSEGWLMGKILLALFRRNRKR